MKKLKPKHGLGSRLLKTALNKLAQEASYVKRALDPTQFNAREVQEPLKQFKDRLNSKEGLKRLNYLYPDKQDSKNVLDMLNDLKVYKNPDIVGQFTVVEKRDWTRGPDSFDFTNDPQIQLHPKLEKKSINKVLRHEWEHAVQGAGSKIDEDLLKLKLTPDIKNQVKHSPQFGRFTGMLKKESVDPIEDTAINFSTQLKNMSKKDHADYFLNGSTDRERSAFLSEVQEWALENKLIKHPYEKVNAKKLQEIYENYVRKNDYPLRIFDIMEPNKENFNLLADNFNRLLTTGVVGVGLGIGSTQLKTGGKLKRLKSKNK